ncbi:MAG: glucose-6-phosphate isomerase [Bryobacteraceae bacterium]|nr:glucose-6-phosphate isomerase [Bryobacteraceae bacterium]
MTSVELWTRYQHYLCPAPSIGLTLDISRMHFDDGFFAAMEPRLQTAYAAMDELERGAIANPDEQRMVGHYWLRSPQMAPTTDIRDEIARTLTSITEFTAKIWAEARFSDVLCIGIGGSALGPMFVSQALGEPLLDPMRVQFIDNTDPDGIVHLMATLKQRLDHTLCIVTSKSGGTPETRNGMIIVAEYYKEAGLDFTQHAIAITMPGSKLDKKAESEGWLARFPMFDWVGGRTSELSAVGLLPAALQGIDIEAMLQGAAACDDITRGHETMTNPAALLAAMWYEATDGKGRKDMVVLPYKDRLSLFSRYLQQLVMESLGKELDLSGQRVEQGIAVYGNKGSTDQHAYVQQLREGVNNFFAIFIRVLEVGSDAIQVEPGVTAGDYLHGFLLGTREALHANGRESLTITLQRVDAFTVGALIALFERAVGLYASLINVNAYHQPGVEAGKKAAADVLDLQRKVMDALSSAPQSAAALAENIGASDHVETILHLLEHLAANDRAVQSGENFSSVRES